MIVPAPPCVTDLAAAAIPMSGRCCWPPLSERAPVLVEILIRLASIDCLSRWPFCGIHHDRRRFALNLVELLPFFCSPDCSFAISSARRRSSSACSAAAFRRAFSAARPGVPFHLLLHRVGLARNQRFDLAGGDARLFLSLQFGDLILRALIRAFQASSGFSFSGSGLAGTAKSRRTDWPDSFSTSMSTLDVACPSSAPKPSALGRRCGRRPRRTRPRRLRSSARRHDEAFIFLSTRAAVLAHTACVDQCIAFAVNGSILPRGRAAVGASVRTDDRFLACCGSSLFDGDGAVARHSAAAADAHELVANAQDPVIARSIDDDLVPFRAGINQLLFAVGAHLEDRWAGRAFGKEEMV